MPQATQDPKKAAEQRAREEWAALVKRATEGDTSGARQVARAVALEAERAKNMKAVDSNRKYLRLMDDNGELSDDQAAFIDTFYPEKEMGEQRSQDEIDATRRAREAARKS